MSEFDAQIQEEIVEVIQLIRQGREACNLARVAFEDAITEPDNVDEGSYKDSTEVSRVSAVIQFGPGAVDDPFVKVKGLITDLINRVQSEGHCHDVWWGALIRISLLG